ncbi:MAG: amino acid adenylation domain-containing protein [Deltaproteobacteria bacterium]|nr:amino acid adenylation domain-containing protein [Deltaproteobacteria bacterium]
MNYKASDLQRQYWLQAQMAPNSVAYNIVSTFKLDAGLQTQVLKKAFQLVIESHPIFSSRFVFKDGTLEVVEDSNPPTSLETPTDTYNTDEAALNAVKAFASKPFNLATGPLLRALLAPVQNGNAYLTLSAHHSVIDLKTKDMLGQAISQTYNSLLKTGKADGLSAESTYQDYVDWYSNWLNDEPGIKEKAFWVAEYQNMSEGLDFPCDFTRPSSPSFKGATVTISGSTEELKNLRSFCQKEVTQPYLVLLACYLLLLRKYTRDDVITVGIPLTNRVRPEHRDTMGCFMNIVPLTVKATEDMTFSALLQSVRKAMLICHRHQSLPFTQIVDAIAPPRDSSRNPLFQTLFTFEHPMSLALDGVNSQIIEIHAGGAQLDFSMNLWLSDDGLRGHFEYTSDLLENETAKRLVSHFKQAIAAVTENPNLKIHEVSLFKSNEYNLIVKQWNDTRKAYPPIDGLHQFLERQAIKTPDNIALEMPEKRALTYREFNAKCNQLAHCLMDMGVKKGTRIGVHLKRSLEMVISLHAIVKAGGIYVPMEPDFPSDRKKQMLADAEVPFVLQVSGVEIESDNSTCTVFLDKIQEKLNAMSVENPDVGITEADDAYIIFTSGSTGRPKGVLNGHAGICNRINWMQEAFQLNSDDVVLQKTPFTFDVSVWEFFWPFVSGARLAVAPPEAHKDPAALGELIGQFKVSTIHFVPSMLEVFLGSPSLATARESLKRIICSGEALGRPLQDKCLSSLSNVGLYNLYGPTEAAVDVTSWECHIEDSKASVPIGRAIANTQIYILDAYLNPVPIGVPGELHIGGVQVARGYVNRSDLTAERFIADPFDITGKGRLYKTGDWARFRPDGNIEYISRMDGQVKIHGLRIELEEINVAIREEIENIQQVVTVINSDTADTQLVAYIVLSDSVPLDESHVRHQLAHRLPSYMIPDVLVTVNEIPLSSNGKVDRRRLPSIQARIQNSSSGQKATTDTEMEVLDIWKEILKLDEIGVERNFFDVGGTSILAAHLANRLNETFCQTLSPVFLFRYTCIREQSRYLDEIGRDSSLDFSEVHKRAEKRRMVQQRRRKK